MESEKVKEIKYYLEQSACMYGNMQKQALALINELESENERLQEENGVLIRDLDYINRKFTNAETRIDDYIDRIAELEKENKKLLDSIETVQNDRCVYKCELTKKHLKQFTEIFKQKCIDGGIFPAFVARKLEETLKEFIENESDN